MEEKDKHMEPDQLFSDALTQLEVQPSAKVWDGIEEALDQPGRKPAFWWWLSGLLLVLISAVVISLSLFSENKPVQQFAFLKAVHTPLPGPAKDALKATTLESADSHPATLAAVRADSVPVRAQADSVSQARSTDHLAETKTAALPAADRKRIAEPDPRPGYSPGTNPIGLNTNTALSHNPGKEKSATAIPSGVKTGAGAQKPVALSKSAAPDPSAGAVPASGSSFAASSEKPGTGPKEQSEKTAVSQAPARNVQARTDAIPVNTSAAMPSAGNPGDVQTSSFFTVKKPGTADSVSAAAGKPETPPVLTVTAALRKADSLKSASLASSSATAGSKQDSLTLAARTDSLKSKSVPLSGIGHTAQADSGKPAAAAPFLFILSGYAAPELAMNRIVSNSGPFDVKSEKQNPRMGGGLTFSLCFKDKVVVTLGCAYSQNHQEMNPQQVLISKTQSRPFVFNSSFGDMAVPAATMLSGFNPAAPVPGFHCKYQYNQTVQYLQIPLTLGYRLHTGRFGASASAGINFQYAFSSSGTLELLKENETDRVDYNSLDVRKINAGLLLNLGADYAISKHLGVFLEPGMRLNLLSSSNGGAVQSTGYMASVAAGLRISL